MFLTQVQKKEIAERELSVETPTLEEIQKIPEGFGTAQDRLKRPPLNLITARSSNFPLAPPPLTKDIQLAI
jgi:hypothetical protein